MVEEFILETRGLTKEFKGFVAVKDVDLKVSRGSIHALIGPNGAGKTTVFNLLTKFLRPDRGRIFYNGDDITSEEPAQIARRGIVRSFQISAVFPHLTVLENVRIGLQRKLGASFHFWKPESSLNRLNDRAMQLLGEVGLDSLAVRLDGDPRRADLDPTHLDRGPDADAPTREGLRHLGGDFLVLDRQDARQRLEQRDLDAVGRVHVRELNTHRAGADDHERSRRPLVPDGAVRRDHAILVDGHAGQ